MISPAATIARDTAAEALGKDTAGVATLFRPAQSYCKNDALRSAAPLIASSGISESFCLK